MSNRVRRCVLQAERDTKKLDIVIRFETAHPDAEADFGSVLKRCSWSGKDGIKSGAEKIHESELHFCSIRCGCK